MVQGAHARPLAEEQSEGTSRPSTVLAADAVA